MGNGKRENKTKKRRGLLILKKKGFYEFCRFEIVADQVILDYFVGYCFYCTFYCAAFSSASLVSDSVLYMLSTFNLIRLFDKYIPNIVFNCFLHLMILFWVNFTNYPWGLEYYQAHPKVLKSDQFGPWSLTPFVHHFIKQNFFFFTSSHPSRRSLPSFCLSDLELKLLNSAFTASLFDSKTTLSESTKLLIKISLSLTWWSSLANTALISLWVLSFPSDKLKVWHFAERKTASFRVSEME